VPAAQPKRTTPATPKTKPSETPRASFPSTGTGYRCATVDAASTPKMPASVVAPCGSPANANAAAT